MTEAEWLTSDDPTKMLQFLGSPYPGGVSGTGADGKPYALRVSDRRLRLFACACCRLIWNRLSDERTRTAVETAEQYADRNLSRVTASLASRAAMAVWSMGSHSLPATVAAIADPLTNLPVRIPDLFQYMPLSSHFSAAFLRDIFGNPFRPVSLCGDPVEVTDPVPFCLACQRILTADVRSVAQAAYDSVRENGTLDPVRLSILADCLEEAGCDSEEILTHLRSPGPHVRGCWVLDLIFGKE